MPRTGVDYETIKRTAIKLLSQGSAPSVQKIREVLGTGSNTTIAAHLNVWREEYATQEIHHLPASMPKELVSAMEALWQTAIEHASNQLATIKAELTAQQEKIQREKIITEKTIADLTNALTGKEQNLAVSLKEIQALETQLAVEQERVSKAKEAQSTLRKQHELRLKHAMDEKHTHLDQIHHLQDKIAKLEQQQASQAEKHQAQLTQERQLQEQSEARWLQLIDQSRQETSQLRKQFNHYQQQSEKTQKQLNQKLLKLQEHQYEQTTTIKVTLEKMEQLKHEKNALLADKKKLTATVAKLQDKLNRNVANKPKKTRKQSQKLAELEL